MRSLFPALMLFLVACPKPGDDVAVLTFDARVDGLAAACGTDYQVGSARTTAQLADARLFVSGIELRDADGSWVPLVLDSTDWQTADIALLDFEDGTGSCADSGTSETNHTVSGTVPPGDYDGVRFDVGVPFESNHIDSATAPTPLNAPGMFWVWQGGYKFVRVDWMTGGDTPSRWNVHLGSTGCVSDAPTTAPRSACGHPNLASVETVDLDLSADVLGIELAELVATADITANTAETPPGCMSSPTEPSDCAPTFDALGLSWETGTCADGCADQSLFEVR